MSKSAQATTGHVKAFQKPARSSEGRSLLPIGIVAAGASMCVVGVLTALPTAPHPIFETVAEVIGRGGLDKGPLVMSGLVMAALGVLAGQVQRAARAARGASQNDGTSEAMGALASDVEAVSAILASVQGELSSIRSDAQELRRRSDNEKQSREANGEGSDPMFRLAASLDQLGATIGKRVEAVRGEMLEAVEAVRERVADTQDHDEAMRAEREQAKEFEALRLDIADIAGRFRTIETELSRFSGASAEGPDGVDECATADIEPPAAEIDPPLPRELNEADAAPASTLPPAPMAEPVAEPKAEPMKQAPEAAPAPSPAPIPTRSLEDEAPAPPPPIPRPSEGLQLIDDMDEDTARAGDVTPPLFPDIDSAGPGRA